MDILVDFDCTCTAYDFPNIGKDIGAQRVLKRLVDSGHNLILFTCRSNKKDVNLLSDKVEGIVDVCGNFLDEAINWFKKNNIPLYGVQKHPTQDKWTTSPKAYGQLLIDDTALGCPTKFDDNISVKPFVDWEEVERLLEIRGLFD